MKIVAVIPARYASTRMPGKPLVDLCGKPMIQRVFEQASRSRLITEVIIATDDERIRTAALQFGASVVMTSPEIQSGSDRIAVAVKESSADIVVNVQGDEPLIDPEMIDHTITTLIDSPDAVVSTAVKRTSSAQDLFNTSVVKVVLGTKNQALYFSRSPIPHVRDAKKDSDWFVDTVFYKHFGIYVYRAAFLQRYVTLPVSRLEDIEKLEQLRVLENGYTIVCAITECESIPVDTLMDAEKVRSILKQ